MLSCEKAQDFMHAGFDMRMRSEPGVFYRWYPNGTEPPAMADFTVTYPYSFTIEQISATDWRLA